MTKIRNIRQETLASWLGACGIAAAHPARPTWQVRGLGPRGVRKAAADLAATVASPNGHRPATRQVRAHALAFAQHGYDVRSHGRDGFAATSPDGLHTFIATAARTAAELDKAPAPAEPTAAELEAAWEDAQLAAELDHFAAHGPV